MKPAQNSVQRPSQGTSQSSASIGTPLDHLEELVNELIKVQPEETLVRLHMKAAGIRYTLDPVDRMTTVLDALEKARFEARHESRAQEYGKTYGKDL